MSEEIAVRQSGMMTLKSISDRVNMVHQVLEKVMIKGTHYGTVPGCGAKMVLLKPGADVLAMTFRLVPQFKVEKTDLENGHREYDVTCTMYANDGSILGQGVGSGSTMEKKYRYRNVDGKKIENEDIADVYNTVLKMAKKRAQIDATLTVTGAADMFTQDLIENEDDTPKEPIKEPQEKKKEETPAQEKADTAECEYITGIPDAASSKPVGNGTKYAIKLDGSWYSTFSQTIGESLLGYKGVNVKIGYVINKGYFNLTSIAAV